MTEESLTQKLLRQLVDVALILGPSPANSDNPRAMRLSHGTIDEVGMWTG
jgi:hypothetical protein